MKYLPPWYAKKNIKAKKFIMLGSSAEYIRNFRLRVRANPHAFIDDEYYLKIPRTKKSTTR